MADDVIGRATAPALLGGRYELGPLLGYGGMAEVFRARDLRLGRDVAIKVLRADLSRDPSFLERFRREAQNAAGLSDPGIVSVYDTGQDVLDERPGSPALPFIVMEFVEGRTLRDVLQQEGPLPSRRACQIVADVCAALACAHDSGVVHRDVKPANVMITTEGAVKVMDFGIARAVSASSGVVTQTSAVIGTAQYLSPEQARGEHVDARSDVYSAGCLLYELLTGQPPFTGDSPVAVAYQHVREDPIPPSRLEPDVPAALDAIVLTAMAKRPGDRYPSALDLQADLERAAAGRRVAATTVATPVAARTTVVPTTVLTRPDGPPVVAPAVQTTVLGAPPPPRRSGRGAAYALLALAVVGVFLVAALGIRALLDRNRVDRVQVPRVVGQQLADAQRLLDQQGLVLSVSKREGQRDTRLPKDQVLSQVPSEGLSARKGQAVDVVVSDGQMMLAVPAVLRQNVDDAKRAITDAGLRVGKVDQIIADPAVAVGTVLGVGPTDGTVVPIGSTVSLRIAGDLARVPDVKGKGETEAVAELRAGGFTVGRRSESPETLIAPGTVLSTSPGPGPVKRGATVDYAVAGLPPPPSPTPPPPPPSASPVASTQGSPAPAPSVPSAPTTPAAPGPSSTVAALPSAPPSPVVSTPPSAVPSFSPSR